MQSCTAVLQTYTYVYAMGNDYDNDRTRAIVRTVVRAVNAYAVTNRIRQSHI